MKKRVWSILIVLSVLLSLLIPALADEPVGQEDSAALTETDEMVAEFVKEEAAEDKEDLKSDVDSADIEIPAGGENFADDKGQEPVNSMEFNVNGDENTDLSYDKDNDSVTVVDGYFIYDPLTQVTPVDEAQLFDDEYIVPFPSDGTSYKDAAEQNEVLWAMYNQIENFFESDEEPKSTEWEYDSKTVAGYELTFTDLSDAVTISDFESYLYAAYSMYDSDHPYETCTLSGAIGLEYSYVPGSSEYTCKVFFGYRDGYTEKRTALKSAVASFDNEFQCADLSTDVEKYKFIHDYLCENLTYDGTGADAHNAYGALVGGDDSPKGSVVCQGYSDAFLLLCQKENLPCVYVSGYGYHSDGSSEAHGWNHVKIDGKWYAIDCTWDDVESEYIDSDSIFNWSVDYGYEYFGDNSRFTDGMTVGGLVDHWIGSQYNFDGGSWRIAAPTLDGADYLGENMGKAKITITSSTQFQNVTTNILYNPDLFGNVSEFDIMISDSENVIIQNYSYDGDYTNIFEIPEGKIYTVHGSLKCESQSGMYSMDGNDTISNVERSPIEISGTLNLENATLTGSNNALASMVKVKNGGILNLIDVTVDGNSGYTGAYSGYTGDVYGIECQSGGKVVLNGKCSITGNADSSGNAANLYLSDQHQLTIGDNLSGEIGITLPSDAEMPFTLATDVPTIDAVSIFTIDNPIEDAVLDLDEGSLIYRTTYTTDKDMEAYFQYATDTTIPTEKEQTVQLVMEPEKLKDVRVFAVSYTDGAMQLEVKTCTVASDNTVVLPKAAADTELYKVFVLNGDGAPCSEALVLSERAATS